jgi:murein DD-endopeptidase MepM/ murein hydrolase activator NlpD
MVVVKSPEMRCGKFIEMMPLERLRDKHWSKWLAVAVLAFLAVEGSLLATIIHRRNLAEESLTREKRLAVEDAKIISAEREVHTIKELPSRTTFSEFLEQQGLQASVIQELVQETRPVYNLAQVRAGNQVTLVTSGTGALKEVGYEIDLDHMLWIKKEADGFHPGITKIPYAVDVAGVGGTVHNSLFLAVEDAGENDQLALNIADIFGWDIDFNTDTQNGDKFEVVVEKKILNGKFVGYGRILAAEYDNAGHPYQALLFHEPSGQPAYYAPSGKAVKKAFLRSPLRFAAPITSRFSYHRFHPILRHSRPHLGIDYGAPVGSKVQAVADGRVDFAGWQGGGGKEVRLHHTRGYETYYLHLSRILVHRGQHVNQGQVIALTGATGLATGPHLDFRIAEDGRFRNFLALKLPPARSVDRRDWPAFQKVRERLLGELASVRAHTGGVQQATLLPQPSSGASGR